MPPPSARPGAAWPSSSQARASRSASTPPPRGRHPGGPAAHARRAASAPRANRAPPPLAAAASGRAACLGLLERIGRVVAIRLRWRRLCCPLALSRLAPGLVLLVASQVPNPSVIEHQPAGAVPQHPATAEAAALGRLR